MMETSSGKLWTLIPFAVFVLVFLGTGIYFNDFYALPSPVAVSIGIIVAFLILRGTMKEKLDDLLKGLGDRNILTMCVIYLLAGAFATVAKAIGATDAIVQIGINNLAPQYYPVGVFLIASFLSIASGTSVGTVVALGPIVVGLADAGGSNINIIGAALLGGAMFGDNLSIISDTTIAATQLMGVEMRDKFKNNFRFALPAAILATLLYFYAGMSSPADTSIENLAPLTTEQFLLVIPYLAVLILAFFGIDVFTVLVIGIILGGAFGFIYSDFTFMDYSQNIYEGFTGMTEIFLLSWLTGGLAFMIEQAGGIAALLHILKKGMKGVRTALYGIGTFVGCAAVATANNTVSIILAGRVSQKITEDFQIRPRVTASILDTFSCIVQGALPYGAQILILTGFSHNELNYVEVMKHHYYIYLLLIAAVIYILIGKVKSETPVKIEI